MQKLAVITGATAGIGEATALKLASLGYGVVITGRREERVQALKCAIEKQYSAEVQCLCFDVRSEQACMENLARIPAEQQIDLLVNNAGLASGLEHIDQGDTQQWNAMIDTNVMGLLYVTRVISPRMVTQCHGHIVTIGSIAGTQPYENGAVYCASKHAVHAISQSMRIDLVAHGVKVTEIRPGMVETEFSVVRFGGDEQRAKGVYSGVAPLTGEDIAEAIGWVVTLPAHVNIDDMLITPQQQANAYTTFRKE